MTLTTGGYEALGVYRSKQVNEGYVSQRSKRDGGRSKYYN